MSQNDLILKHLEKYGSISPLEAINEYGIMRLSARISDLKAKGVVIRTKSEVGANRRGEPTIYARYHLVRGDSNS